MKKQPKNQWNPELARKLLIETLEDFQRDESFYSEQNDILYALETDIPFQNPVFFGAFCMRVLGHIPKQFSPNDEYEVFNDELESKYPPS